MSKEIKTFKFQPNLWVIFEYEHFQFIGRTCVINGLEIVSFIDNFGGNGSIEWKNINNPRVLNIMKKSEAEKQTVQQQKPEDFDGKNKPLMLSWVMGDC